MQTPGRKGIRSTSIQGEWPWTISNGPFHSY